MMTTNPPNRCPLCGYYLTTAVQFAGYRCFDPGHWQAAGLLAPRDYYALAKIAAQAKINFKKERRTTNS